jgi:hypothetical protein
MAFSFLPPSPPGTWFCWATKIPENSYILPKILVDRDFPANLRLEPLLHKTRHSNPVIPADSALEALTAVLL